MSLPPRISIAGIQFTIKQRHKGLKKTDFGRLFWDERIIAVNKNKDETIEWDTLEHEITHACFYASGLTWLLDKGMEESIVRMIEHLLLPVIRKIYMTRHRNQNG